MNIQEIQAIYARLPQVAGLAKLLEKNRVKTVFLEGLLGSSAPLLFASLAKKTSRTMLFILQDTEEAGYFYHDLTQIMGEARVLFFPSSYRRSIKYGQKDPASEILRTEVLTSISHPSTECLYIVSSPEALAEMGLHGRIWIRAR